MIREGVVDVANHLNGNFMTEDESDSPAQTEV